MSKIDDLIQEFCPDGVEYKPIKKLAEVGTGSSNGNEAQEDGKYPFFIRSQTVKRKNEWEYDEEAIIIPGEGGIGEIYHYVNGKYAIHQRVYRIHFTDNSVDVKFAYHYFRAFFKNFIMRKAVSATVKSIRKPMIEEFMLPVPPLEVQREIVHILDSFTLLTADLTAELTARQKQYAFYRDYLLDFSNEDVIKKIPDIDCSNVEYLTLNDVCEFVRGPFGGSLKKEIFINEGYAVYEQQNAIYNRFKFRYFISKNDFQRLKRFEVKTNDLIMSCSGTMGKIAIIPDNAPKGIINQALLKLTPKSNIDSHYLKYYFENTISKIMNDSARGGAIKNVASVSELKKISIPVPPLSVQENIVKILDRFDKLNNDMSEGLPAEIEARKKQYEYYRDTLLSFDDKACSHIVKVERERANTH